MIRTQEGVLLDDASADNVYSKDEYVRQKRSRSILCLPIVKQAKLVGALYLENNLTPGAFTPDRVTVLQLLASQAAISLENATLYSDLQLQARLSCSGSSESARRGTFGLECLTSGEIYWSDGTYKIFESIERLSPRSIWISARPSRRSRFDRRALGATRSGTDGFRCGTSLCSMQDGSSHSISTSCGLARCRRKSPQIRG